MHRLFLFIAISCTLVNCGQKEQKTDAFAHISDAVVVQTLKKSFAALGGLENWQQIQGLVYDKNTKLYLESGEIERESNQLHEYSYGKEPTIQISWEDAAGQAQKIVATNGTPTKYTNGTVDESANTTTLNTTITTSLFVINVPFKLMDQGVLLSHEGNDTLEDGQVVEVIKAVYDPNQFSHHTTPDIWWYYFDIKTYKLVGYMVKHADHYSYIRNLAYAQTGGFTFPAKRVSYRVTPDRKILYKRADYLYKNWKIIQP